MTFGRRGNEMKKHQKITLNNFCTHDAHSVKKYTVNKNVNESREEEEIEKNMQNLE